MMVGRREATPTSQQWLTPPSSSRLLEPLLRDKLLSWICILVVVITSSSMAAVASKAPDASSTILKMHKMYTLQPPHDSKLYDILHVSPNATMVQIAKSYRKLNRKFHPDKLVSASSSSRSQAEVKLQQIQQAYDILKDDRTRLPYHQYGLIDTSLAVLVLMGPQTKQYATHHHAPDPVLLQELLHLMGYTSADTTSSSSTKNDIFHQIDGRTKSESSSDVDDLKLRQRQRRGRIAARLAERIRPLVEGTVDESMMAHVIAEECDRLKTLPMGAHIIRCVGRAYRHAGQDYLTRHKHKQEHYNKQHRNLKKEKIKKPGSATTSSDGDDLPRLSLPEKPTLPMQVATDVSLNMRQQWRQAKSYWTAALASGRVAWAEQKWTRQERQRQERQKLRKKKRQKEQQQQQKLIDGKRDGDDKINTDNNQLDMKNEMFVDSGDDDESDYFDFLDDYNNGDGDDYDDQNDEEEEIKELERLKAQQALLHSMQVEALWKVSKIDLDHTIRDACRMILEGEESERYLFPNGHYQQHTMYPPPPPPPPPRHDGSSSSSIHGDGWISRTGGQTIYADIARLRAAAAMIMIGDIFVHCSKQGTSWKD